MHPRSSHTNARTHTCTRHFTYSEIHITHTHTHTHTDEIGEPFSDASGTYRAGGGGSGGGSGGGEETQGRRGTGEVVAPSRTTFTELGFCWTIPPLHTLLSRCVCAYERDICREGRREGGR